MALNWAYNFVILLGMGANSQCYQLKPGCAFCGKELDRAPVQNIFLTDFIVPEISSSTWSGVGSSLFLWLHRLRISPRY